MIDRIVIENFKSLRRVDLSLGRMNLFIGANASGKSNFLDALRVLQGIGNGFTIGETLDGKPKSATSAVWGGIRGGSAMTRFAGAEDGADVSIDLQGQFKSRHPWETVRAEDPRLQKSSSWPTWAFTIAFSPENGRVTRERFTLGQHAVYHFCAERNNLSRGVAHYDSGTGNTGEFHIDTNQPALGQFASRYGLDLYRDCPREHPKLADRTAALLANTQRVDLVPAHLWGYSDGPQARRMGDRGENFAALVNTICREDKTKGPYLSWLQELRPEEVTDVGVLEGALGEPLFMLDEGGRRFPAPALSDGTLRFAALAAAFFQPDMPGVMMLEEIENGVHANRLRVLLELLRTQAEETNTQVVATTHSPTVLDWLEERDYETTFLCKRDDQTGESRIRALAEVPQFVDVVKKTPASELLAEGWLEAAP